MKKTESPPDDQASAPERPAEHLPVGKAELTLTPAAWAEVLFPNTPTGRLHDDLWKHGAAQVLHGWPAYVNRTGKELFLSESDYRAALAAASSTDLKPHPGADYRQKD